MPTDPKGAPQPGSGAGPAATGDDAGDDRATARDRLAANLPCLRRYARAVTGSQASGDAFVRMTLEASLTDPRILAQVDKGGTQLYRAFTALWNTARVEVDRTGDEGNDTPDEGAQGVVQARLDRVSPLQRQALLLTQLEEFTLTETAEILGIEPDEAQALVQYAIEEIEREALTDVLIIEDEPLISSHLETIVGDIGHRVVATAATADQAREAYVRHRPGLVLADIQLADGSSGIKAVEDILELGPVPVIFITAFPEKLLTGERPEPAFLVAKPFREQTVRATISQALFFGAPIEG